MYRLQNLQRINRIFIDTHYSLQYNKSKYIAYKGSDLMTKKNNSNIVGIVHGNLNFADERSGGIKAGY